MIKKTIAFFAAIEKIKKLRQRGRFRQGWSQALRVAASARRAGFPESEMLAFWEALDCGKIVCPEKKRLLENLGRRSCLLARRSGSRAYMDEADVRRAALLRTLGRHAQAQRYLSRIVGRASLAADPVLYGYGLWNLAFAQRMELKLNLARQNFLRARRLLQTHGDVLGAAYADCGLAGVTRLLGKPRESLRLYASSRAVFVRQRDLYGQAYAHCGMGNAWRRLGFYVKALAAYKIAKRLYSRLGDEVNLGYVLWGSLVCLRQLGRLKEATHYERQAARLFFKAGDARGQALLRVWNGIVRPQPGRAQRARHLGPLRGCAEAAVTWACAARPSAIPWACTACPPAAGPGAPVALRRPRGMNTAEKEAALS